MTRLLSRRAAPAALLLLTAPVSGCAPPGPPAHSRVVDLTHPYDETTIYWPTQPLFEHTLTEGQADAGFWYASGTFAAAEHGGTHVDAPSHFWRGGSPVDAIAPERLIGPGAVVDVTASCRDDRDYRVTVEDFQRWERRHGRIPRGAIVLLRTGFGAFYPDRERYMGTAARGPEAVADLHFPGLHPDAARWIANERAIGAIGLDTPSIDHGPSADFAAHVALFERDVPAFENVANLDLLPETGATIVALPMKIRDGSGAPLRIVALLP